MRGVARVRWIEGVHTDAATGTAADLPGYDHRRGTGPTLVLLHYWGGSARTWDAVADLLPTRDLLAIDTRGWGRSAALDGPYDLRHVADDVLAVLRDADVREFVLVGHSMGGKVAQLVGARRPEGLRGIVLVASGPATTPDDITPEYQAQLAHAYDTDESVAAARDTVLTATPLSPAMRAQVLHDSRASAPEAATEWPLHGIAEDIAEDTRRIGVPVLVVAGEHDQVEPVAVQRDHLLPDLTDAHLVVLPGTGHLIPLEAPRPLADAVTAFVDGVLTRS